MTDAGVAGELARLAALLGREAHGDAPDAADGAARDARAVAAVRAGCRVCAACGGAYDGASVRVDWVGARARYVVARCGDCGALEGWYAVHPDGPLSPPPATAADPDDPDEVAVVAALALRAGCDDCGAALGRGDARLSWWAHGRMWVALRCPGCGAAGEVDVCPSLTPEAQRRRARRLAETTLAGETLSAGARAALLARAGAGPPVA